MILTLNLNDIEYKADAAPDTPLLWVMTGTKYSCGVGHFHAKIFSNIPMTLLISL